jgi:NADH-quinone oxidoreductase subunit J
MRIIVLLTSLALAFMAMGATAQIAEAQPAPAAQPGAAQPRVRATTIKKYPHGDRVESTGKGMALLFWAFAAASVGGALFVVTRRNLIAAVMGMVGSFLGIAAVYMMLYASFLAVIQVLVYAGAIMVLFVFVVMILNRPEDEPVAPSGRLGHVVGVAAMVYLVFRLAMLLVNVKAPPAAMGPPAPVAVTTTAPARTATAACDRALCGEQGGTCVVVDPRRGEACQVRISHEWGSVRAVGTDLFGPGVFPFEAISILLHLAVVGAIAIARPAHEEDKPEPEPGAGAGGHV